MPSPEDRKILKKINDETRNIVWKHYANVPLTNNDIKERLLPIDKWLNDDLMNAYYSLIEQNVDKYKTYLPNVFLLTKLRSIDNEKQPESKKIEKKTELVQRWAKRAYDMAPEYETIVQNLEQIILSVNVDESHWVTYYIEPKKGVITFYDSLCGKANPVDLKNVRFWLNYYFPDKKFTDTQGDSPKQPGGSNCGVYSLYNLKFLAYGCEITRESLGEPTNAWLKRLREQLAIELMTGKIHGVDQLPGQTPKQAKIPGDEEDDEDEDDDGPIPLQADEDEDDSDDEDEDDSDDEDEDDSDDEDEDDSDDEDEDDSDDEDEDDSDDEDEKELVLIPEDFEWPFRLPPPPRTIQRFLQNDLKEFRQYLLGYFSYWKDPEYITNILQALQTFINTRSRTKWEYARQKYSRIPAMDMGRIDAEGKRTYLEVNLQYLLRQYFPRKFKKLTLDQEVNLVGYLKPNLVQRWDNDLDDDTKYAYYLYSWDQSKRGGAYWVYGFWAYSESIDGTDEDRGILDYVFMTWLEPRSRESILGYIYSTTMQEVKRSEYDRRPRLGLIRLELRDVPPKSLHRIDDQFGQIMIESAPSHLTIRHLVGQLMQDVQAMQREEKLPIIRIILISGTDAWIQLAVSPYFKFETVHLPSEFPEGVHVYEQPNSYRLTTSSHARLPDPFPVFMWP
uniref:Ubiquitin-like protease family profile domain-containing protein n=1 Tax=viral metagenome TaxID=1070528 RepID=A0A6C0BNX2_9ZZZZ